MRPLPAPQQLRYLLALHEHRHFGRAAEACSVTQSTLSAGVMSLERLLDAVLLDRSAGKRVLFTPLGDAIAARGRRALAALEAVVESADAIRGPMTGPLRLGMIPTVGSFLLPRLMPALRAAFPRLQLFLREDLTHNLVSALERGKLDALLLALPCACAEAAILPLARDELVVALPPGHRLAGEACITAEHLAAEPMLLLEEGHCLRDNVLAACPGAGGEQEGRFAATSLHTLVQMVAGGLGITLLPRLAVAGGVAEGAGLALRPLAGPAAFRELGLAWRAEAPRAADYRLLADHVVAALAGVTQPAARTADAA